MRIFSEQKLQSGGTIYKVILSVADMERFLEKLSDEELEESDLKRDKHYWVQVKITGPYPDMEFLDSDFPMASLSWELDIMDEVCQWLCDREVLPSWAELHEFNGNERG